MANMVRYSLAVYKRGLGRLLLQKTAAFSLLNLCSYPKSFLEQCVIMWNSKWISLFKNNVHQFAKEIDDQANIEYPI